MHEQPLITETFALIAHVVPTLSTFAELHRAHRVFWLNAAHQYMVRARFRHVVNSRKTKLPTGRKDGLTLNRFTRSDVCRLEYCVNGKMHGKCLQWLSGRLYSRDIWIHGNMHQNAVWYHDGSMAVQHYVDNVLHGESVHYDEHGQVLDKYIWTHGVRA